MAGKAPDVNAALIRKVKSLSVDSKNVFLKTFTKAPLMLGLFNFLEVQQEEKCKTADAVAHLYKVKNSHADYMQYENRFFKLRKKFYDYFHTTSTANVNEIFTPHEILLHEIKGLVLNGNYVEAGKLLPQLEGELWNENIFELLPEVLEMTMHNNQLLRKVEANMPLYKKQTIATELHADLYEAKKLAREIFDINVQHGVKKAAAHFLKLQRLSINRKEYPRFKLIYNLISATCKLGGGGLDFKPDFKITNRFISTLNKIHTLHPNMPDYSYMAGYTHTQDYRFKNLQIMNHFNALHFKEAALAAKEIYGLVMADNSPLKRMRGPFQFSSFCQVFTLGEQYHDALASANQFLHYARETREAADLLKAYMEIANAHIWLYPIRSGYTDSFVAQKIEEFIRSVSKGEYSHYYLGLANWTKIKLLLVTGDYPKAKSVFFKRDFSSYFMEKNLSREAEYVIGLVSDSKADRKKIGGQLSKLRTLKLKTQLPPDYQNYMFLEKILQRKLKEQKF